MLDGVAIHVAEDDHMALARVRGIGRVSDLLDRAGILDP